MWRKVTKILLNRHELHTTQQSAVNIVVDVNAFFYLSNVKKESKHIGQTLSEKVVPDVNLDDGENEDDESDNHIDDNNDLEKIFF